MSRLRLTPARAIVLTTLIVVAAFSSHSVQSFNGGSTKGAAVALPIAPPDSFVGDNTGLTSSPSGSQMWNHVTWWTWTPSTTETFAVRASSINPGGWDNTLEVWTGAGASTLVTDNDDFYGLDAQVTFTATAGQTYVIGLGSYSGTRGTATIRFIPLPVAPTAVSGTPGNASVNVSWTMANANEQSITSYRVYRYINGVQDGAATTVSGLPPTAAATVNGLTNGTAYTFAVSAVNSVGEGPLSTPSAAVTPAGAPGVPSSVAATAGAASASVAFVAPNNGGSPITSYTVTASPGGANTVGSSSPITVAGLTDGVAYTFTVAATNVHGTSAASAPSAAVTPLAARSSPAQPTGITAVAGNAQATVSFSPPANPGTSPILGYAVVSSPGGVTATGAGSPLTITGLTNGQTYAFRVYAYSADGVGPESGYSNLVVPFQPCAMGLSLSEVVAPSIGAGGTVALQVAAGCAWSAAADMPWALVAPASGTGPATLTYVVHENNDGRARTATIAVTGDQRASLQISQQARGQLPGAPVALHAIIEGDRVRLDWTTPGNAGEPTDHVVEAGTAPGLTDIGQMNTGSARAFVELPAIPAGTYHLRVRARNTHGASVPSNEIVVTTPARGTATPGAPIALMPMPAAGTRVGVRWSPPAEGLATHYVVEFGRTPGAADVTSMTVTATSVTWDSLAAPDALYYLRVRAFNSAGSGPASEELALRFGQRAAQAPEPPTSLAARVMHGQLTLTWAPPISGREPTGYVVEVSTIPGAANLYLRPVGLGVTSWSFPIVPASRYYLRVRGVNAFGIGAPSAEIAVSSDQGATSGEMPGAPRALSARVDGQRLSLLWSPPSDGGAVQDYVVEVATPDGHTTLATVPTNSAATEWRYDALPAGLAFVARVRAHNAVGHGPASNDVLIGSAHADATTHAATSEAPSTPIGFTATETTSTVTLSWDAPAGGGAVESYLLTVLSADGQPLRVIELLTRSVTASLRDLPSAVYFVNVRAKGANGQQSEPSPTLTVVVP